MESKEKKSKKGYVLGEAVKDRRTGRKMYVDANWHPEVRCVYYDMLTDALVKVEVPDKYLARVKEKVSPSEESRKQKVEDRKRRRYYIAGC
ncbi:hypothetical protein [Leptospira sp. P2653]|uniref:hypothetical protein n=1 Tax=Leptospira sp. P2653 TaxID=1218600 RepID=UPI0009FC497D|nr:hypothetical protein [Leptospira sp. P2653]